MAGSVFDSGQSPVENVQPIAPPVPPIAACIFLQTRMESDAGREIRLIVGRLMESNPTLALLVNTYIYGNMESDSSPIVLNVFNQMMESDGMAKLIVAIRRLMESEPSEALRVLIGRMESDPTPALLVQALKALFESDPSSAVKSCTIEASWLATNIQIRRGIEGPQLILSWEPPTCVMDGMRIKIVRKTGEWSVNPNDGFLVYEGDTAAGCVSDLNLDPCVCYYYTVFTWVPFFDTWVSGPDTQVSEMAIETGYFVNRLMQLLPEVYLIADKKKNMEPDTGHIMLKPVYDDTVCEWFNIHENVNPNIEPKTKGQLWRLIKILASELDTVKGLIDCLPTQYDVDEACCDILPAMAELIALELNREFPCSKQREEIKQEVEIYKIKGTLQSIAAKARAISGVEVAMEEHCKRILRATMLDRTSAGGDIEAIRRYLLPGDKTSYTPGGKKHLMGVSLYLLLRCEDCLPEQVVKKLARVLPDYLPLCRSIDLTAVDCLLTEEYDSSMIQELVQEVEENLPSKDTYYDHCWIWSNRVSTPSNSKYLTLNPFRVCHESDWIQEEETPPTEHEEICDPKWIYSNKITNRSNSQWYTPWKVGGCGIRDSWYEQIEREVDSDTYFPKWKWIYSNCLATRSNSLFTTPKDGVAVDSWWEQVHQLVDEPTGEAVFGDTVYIAESDKICGVPVSSWVYSNQLRTRSNSHFATPWHCIANDFDLIEAEVYGAYYIVDEAGNLVADNAWVPLVE